MAPGDGMAKSLVFSHFQSSIEFLKLKLTEAGYNYRTLSGDMSRAQRTKAPADFQVRPFRAALCSPCVPLTCHRPSPRTLARARTTLPRRSS